MRKFFKKIETSEYGMRLREKFYPSKRSNPAHYALFFQAMERYRKCTNKKNSTQIKHEIQICEQYWKCYPHHYFMYDLYTENCDLTDDELKNYIPQFFWSYLFLPYHTSLHFSPIPDNKILTDIFFRALDINRPLTLCTFLNNNLYSPTMNFLSDYQPLNEIKNIAEEKIFVKPAEGEGGKGLFVFHKHDNSHFINSENQKFDEKFLSNIMKNKDYIIQDGVAQHPDIAKIYPDSVNTFRIITENKNGVVRIICAVLRMGRSHKENDNLSSGGICVNIDMNSGKFGNFAISYISEKFSEHPDTHFKFKNEKISQWDKIRVFTIESAGKLPFLTYLGWDIALTPEGPLAIEINRTPALDIMEMSSFGLREAFGINDPDFFWKNAGNRFK
jgi:hypothetical protein